MLTDTLAIAGPEYYFQGIYFFKSLFKTPPNISSNYLFSKKYDTHGILSHSKWALLFTISYQGLQMYFN